MEAAQHRTARLASSSRSRPIRNIDALISVSQTSPHSPACFANAFARSPLPPATSSTLKPARTPAWAMANAFQRRCSPADIRSFIISYLDATESNTRPTRRLFSSSSFFLNDTATTEIYTLSLHDALPILKMLTMTNLSTECLNQLTKLGYD